MDLSLGKEVLLAKVELDNRLDATDASWLGGMSLEAGLDDGGAPVLGVSVRGGSLVDGV